MPEILKVSHHRQRSFRGRVFDSGPGVRRALPATGSPAPAAPVRELSVSTFFRQLFQAALRVYRKVRPSYLLNLLICCPAPCYPRARDQFTGSFLPDHLPSCPLARYHSKHDHPHYYTAPELCSIVVFGTLLLFTRPEASVHIIEHC